jgi:exonuclease SbcC
MKSKGSRLTFDARLIELGISEAAYRSAIPDIDLIGELEGSIVEFDRELAAARGRQTAARNNVGSAQRPDHGAVPAQLQSGPGSG